VWRLQEKKPTIYCSNETHAYVFTGTGVQRVSLIDGKCIEELDKSIHCCALVRGRHQPGLIGSSFTIPILCRLSRQSGGCNFSQPGSPPSNRITLRLIILLGVPKGVSDSVVAICILLSNRRLLSSLFNLLMNAVTWYGVTSHFQFCTCDSSTVFVMYSDRESRGSKSGRLEYDTFPRECGFRSMQSICLYFLPNLYQVIYGCLKNNSMAIHCNLTREPMDRTMSGHCVSVQVMDDMVQKKLKYVTYFVYRSAIYPTAG